MQPQNTAEFCFNINICSCLRDSILVRFSTLVSFILSFWGVFVTTLHNFTHENIHFTGAIGPRFKPVRPFFSHQILPTWDAKQLTVQPLTYRRKNIQKPKMPILAAKSVNIGQQKLFGGFDGDLHYKTIPEAWTVANCENAGTTLSCHFGKKSVAKRMLGSNFFYNMP